MTNKLKVIQNQILQGDLVKPLFDNEQVCLFNRNPDSVTLVNEVSDPIGPMWTKNTLALCIFSSNNSRWIKVLLQPGYSGWIGFWNAEKVKKRKKI